MHAPGARGYNHADGDSEALPRRLQSWAWQKGELQGRSAAHRAAWLSCSQHAPGPPHGGEALNAHAAAPMQELAELSQAGPTTMLRHEIIMLARDLHNEDTTVSRNAALRVKDLVLASNPEQRQNQKLIANVDGLIDGLINLLRRGSLAGKYYSCHALAQLAWSNPSNSLLIPSV